MSITIQNRRDTVLNWETVNPILGAGERIIITHTNGTFFNTKVGDGVSPFKDIKYDREYITKVVSDGCYVNSGVITSHGRLITWGGADGSGTTGVGNSGEYIPPTEVGFPSEETGQLVNASLFGQQACALFSSGNFYSWAYTGVGQYGDGTTTTHTKPKLTATGVVDYRAPIALSYSTNDTRMFIKKTDNYWYGTGYNGYGAVGFGITSAITSFVQLTALGTSVKNLWNLGGTYGCTVVDTGTALMVAGYNGYGQLGTNNTTTQPSFVNVSSAWGYVAGINDNVISVNGGFGYYDSAANSSCMLTMLIGAKGGTTGKIRTCGNASWYQTGSGTTTQYNLPYLVTGTFKSLDVMGGGPATVYGVTDTNTLTRWGYNSYGQLGSGTTGGTTVITGLVGGKEVKKVHINTTGHTYSYQSQAYVETSDGMMYSTGFNPNGQLGVGDVSDRVIFTPMLFNEKVKQISIAGYGGSHYALIVTEHGELYGIGYNGRQGISMTGTTVNALVPRNLTPQLL